LLGREREFEEEYNERMNGFNRLRCMEKSLDEMVILWEMHSGGVLGCVGHLGEEDTADENETA
jgi:hypothetical protein